MFVLRDQRIIWRVSLLIILLGILPSKADGIFSRFPFGVSRWKKNTKPVASCNHMNTNGKKFLLEQGTDKCHQFGTRGPCPEMMLFYANPLFPQYGFCDCDQGYKASSTCNDSPIRKRIYYPSHNRCYTVFSQGPCRDGMWVTLSESGSLKCTINRCIRFGKTSDTSEQFWFYDTHRRKCLQTLTQEYCEDGHTLELAHESQYPTCQKKSCYPTLVNGVRNPLECAPGSRYSYLTESCQKISSRRLNIG